jgi:16S rRNA (cytosine1402-N4)-methyltransferase
MQIDDPARGFSVKLDGPLDMRMNPAARPARGGAAGKNQARRVRGNAGGECRRAARRRAGPGARREKFATTLALAAAVRAVLPRLNKEDSATFPSAASFRRCASR